MANTVIKNGRIIDPAQNLDETGDLLIEGDSIKKISTGSDDPPKADRTIDADGRIVAPGLVDIHTHLREPGNEDKETIASGAASAIAGGFTTIAAMPNTDPAIDNEASAEYVILQAKRRGLANVLPIGAVTVGREGEKLAEFGQLVGGGAVAFSDDGLPVGNDNIMRQALTYSKMFDTPIINHAEELSLSADGVMNEGTTSTRLGLPGIPAVSEEIMVHRDITLAETTGGHVHIAHVSTAGSVDLIRKGKEKGIHVTAEVTPHHLCLTEEKVESFDSVYKMKPPLRTQKDVEALRNGVADGIIDAIATDHAPHTEEEKDHDFLNTPFGVIGLETALPVSVKSLIETDLLDWPDLIASLSTKPARILNLDKGTLNSGADADVVLIDPDQEWEIDPSSFYSRSRNCPFSGWNVTGKVTDVIVGGNHVFRNGTLNENVRNEM